MRLQAARQGKGARFGVAGRMRSAQPIPADAGLVRRRPVTRLRQARESSGLTHPQAAAELGWALTTILRIEGGTVRVAEVRARISRRLSSIRGHEREVAGMRVDVGSGGPSISGRDRLGGALRLLLYALVCGALGAAAIDGVGNLAVHLLGRRTMVGAFAQLLLAVTGGAVAGVGADRVLARLRHDWAALLATFRPARSDQKGTGIR
jgi:hypothetical protein